MKKKEVKLVEIKPDNDAYLKVIKTIVALNEKIVDGEGDEDDPLWDEIGMLRKQLDEYHNEVVSRLMQSLFYIKNKPLDIDEATPGSPLNFKL